jgi:hypothetical protein
MLTQRYIIPEPSKAETWYAFCRDLISREVENESWEAGQTIAFEWANGICSSLGLPKVSVWKTFKRSLSAKWFGAPERQIFKPRWSVEEVLEYALRFNDRNVRASLFQKNIACHSRSYVLSKEQQKQWKSILESVDQNHLLEVFPESSSEGSLCFRSCFSGLCNDVVYEGGLGQATNVFELERGKHPVVSAQRKSGEDFVWSHNDLPYFEDSKVEIIGERMYQLIERFDNALQLKCFQLCRCVGIEWVALEGYFDPLRKGAPIIVDIDLPFDFIFMPKNRR